MSINHNFFKRKVSRSRESNLRPSAYQPYHQVKSAHASITCRLFVYDNAVVWNSTQFNNTIIIPTRDKFHSEVNLNLTARFWDERMASKAKLKTRVRQESLILIIIFFLLWMQKSNVKEQKIVTMWFVPHFSVVIFFSSFCVVLLWLLFKLLYFVSEQKTKEGFQMEPQLQGFYWP